MKGELTYSKGSLFEAPPTARLVHACNAQGVWGSGIAKEFKERFPFSFKRYEEQCRKALFTNQSHALVGTSIYTQDWAMPWEEQAGSGRTVICLMTSHKYGKEKDSVEEIKVNTTLALHHLLSEVYSLRRAEFASNKFNAGLFGVPWEATEEILKVFVDRYGLRWTVYTGEVSPK